MADSWRDETWRNSGRKKTAGAAVKSDVDTLQRQIGTSFKFDPTNVISLSRVLWSLSVAMAHLIDSYDKFSKIKSSMISPDGLLGGRGYIKSVSDIRQQIAAAQEVVSSLVDTIHDEVHAPYWNKEQLPADDLIELDETLDESDELADEPQVKVDKTYDHEVSEDVKLPRPESLPTDRSDPTFTQWGKYPRSESRVSLRTANSTDIHNLQELGGPRITDRGPGTGPGPYGSWNKDEQEHNPLTNEFKNQQESLYPSEWSGDYSSIYASDCSWHSSLPGSDQLVASESTPDRKPVRKLTASSYSLQDPETNRDAKDFALGWGTPGDGVENSGEELSWFDDFLSPTGAPE